jgi:hypothetical protein
VPIVRKIEGIEAINSTKSSSRLIKTKDGRELNNNK